MVSLSQALKSVNPYSVICKVYFLPVGLLLNEVHVKLEAQHKKTISNVACASTIVVQSSQPCGCSAFSTW